MCTYRRKLRRILRKRVARSCCRRPPRRFILSTTRMQRRSAFSTSPANRAGRLHEQKPESALKASIGRAVVLADRWRKSESALGSFSEVDARIGRGLLCPRKRHGSNTENPCQRYRTTPRER